LALLEKQNHLFNLKDIIKKLTNTIKNTNGFFPSVYCGDIYRLNFFIAKFINNHRDTIDGTDYKGNTNGLFLLVYSRDEKSCSPSHVGDGN